MLFIQQYIEGLNLTKGKKVELGITDYNKYIQEILSCMPLNKNTNFKIWDKNPMY